MVGGACVVAPRGCVVFAGGACMVFAGGMHGFCQWACMVFAGGACMVFARGACVVFPRGGMCGFSPRGGMRRIPRDMVNEWVVHILLECILVIDVNKPSLGAEDKMFILTRKHSSMMRTDRCSGHQ